MTCDPNTTITAADISGLNKDIQTIDDVVDSPDITTTTKDGKTIDTLVGRMLKLGFEPPVIYAGGINLTTASQTIDRNGIIYAPYPTALPFTTSGTWGGDDEDKFYVIQDEILWRVDSIAQLRAFGVGIATWIQVQGYYTEGDGGGDNFYWDAVSTEADNNGTIILPTGWVSAGRWKRELKGELDPVMFGAARDGITDDSTAIQDTVNAAITGGYSIKASAGVYIHSQTIDFVTAVATDDRGGIAFTGEGRATRIAFTQNSPRGTWFKYTGSGTAWLLGDGGEKTSAIRLSDMTLEIGSTATVGLDINHSPQNSQFHNLQIFYLGSGIGIWMRSCYINSFRDIDMIGDFSAPNGKYVVGSKGIYIDNNDVNITGGLNEFTNVTSKYFEVCWQCGEDSLAAVKASRVNTLTNCQTGYCRIGLWIRKGMDGLSVNGFWGEQDEEASIMISDNAENITIDSATFFESEEMTEGTIVLGRDSATASDKYTNRITLRNIASLPCKPAGIKKYAYSGEGQFLYLEQVKFIGAVYDTTKEGIGFNVDPGDHGGTVLGPNIEFFGFNDDFKKIASGTISSFADRRWLVRCVDDQGIEMKVIDGPATPAGYPDLYRMPRGLRFRTSGGSVTLALPTDIDNYLGWGQPTVFIKQNTANEVILDSGPGNLILSDGVQTYTITGASQAITLTPFNNAGQFLWLPSSTNI